MLLKLDDMGVYIRDVNEVSGVYWGGQRVKFVVGEGDFDYTFNDVSEAKDFFERLVPWSVFEKPEDAPIGTAVDQLAKEYGAYQAKQEEVLDPLAMAITNLKKAHGARNPKA